MNWEGIFKVSLELIRHYYSLFREDLKRCFPHVIFMFSTLYLPWNKSEQIMGTQIMPSHFNFNG